MKHRREKNTFYFYVELELLYSVMIINNFNT